MTLRVFLAEDHETVREGLKLIVNAQPDMTVVGEAGDGETAVVRVEQLKPDVVVMDVSMPRLNGLKATERIKKSCPDSRILTLTHHMDGGYLQQLLRAGADGYALKQSAPAGLIHAIRAVAGGGKYLDPAIAGKVTSNFVSPVKSVAAAKTPLSPRETEVLRLISLGHTNKEIANVLDLSVKTVETHKTNAMHKLGMTSRIDIVRFAVLQGWLDESN